MRKLHIKQFAGLVSTLSSACGELKKQKNSQLLNLCADMQEFVSCMYDYAEVNLEENSKLPELLKDFYEILYRIAQRNASVKQAIETLHEIKYETDQLKANKIEAAFFCYKASMSDSLESVYFAAKEDPICDAYFIPIPYFERNPDGSFGQMHLDDAGCYSDRYELTGRNMMLGAAGPM